MNALQDVKNKTPLDQHRTNTSSPRQSVRMTPASSNSSLKSSSTSSSKASSSSAAGSSTLSSGSIQSSDKLDKPANGRPHSHHRRKSSVSTRRESQEIITGVATAEDEETLGSRDEIRKRALLALEGGRNVMSGFSRVEIPEWKTPSAENKTFDWDPGKCIIELIYFSFLLPVRLPALWALSEILDHHRPFYVGNYACH
ncbi:hypothetical protein DL93DRAFT_1861348 [Clavulina sp. PMI_390]|nr:hypothetical protein DL93DRAFT_1861348 [Clavulina sp. PMI_390]